MTRETKKLLKRLIKAQITEDRQVFLSFRSLTAVTVHNGTETYKEVDLSEFKDCMHSILRQLEKWDISRRKNPLSLLNILGFIYCKLLSEPL